MAGSRTSKFKIYKSEVGAEADAWGSRTNEGWDDTDTLLGAKATTGSANAYVLATGLTTALTAYVTGQSFLIIPNFTNSGAATINVDGLGTKNLTKNGTTALASGDIVSGTIYRIAYDGTQFQVLGPLSGVYQPLDATLTAIAALSVANNDLIKATGTDTFTTIGIGTSGTKVPLLDGNNTFSGTATFSANVSHTALAAFGSGGYASDITVMGGNGDSVNWKFGPSTNASGVWYVVNSSNVGAYLTSGSGSWSSTSDERAKNIHDALSDDDALSAICALTPVFYDWKHDETHKLRVGLIAQQTLPILPYAVDQPANPDLMMGIQYGGDAMIAHLIGAIKKLNARIEQLEAA